MLAALRGSAATPAPELVTDRCVKGGASLEVLWGLPGTQEKIAKGGYDVVRSVPQRSLRRSHLPTDELLARGCLGRGLKL